MWFEKKVKKGGTKGKENIWVHVVCMYVMNYIINIKIYKEKKTKMEKRRKKEIGFVHVVCL